jgi:hypothetical protein
MRPARGLIEAVFLGVVVGVAVLTGIGLAGVGFVAPANHTLRKTYDETLPPADRDISPEEQQRAREALGNAIEYSTQVAQVATQLVPGAQTEGKVSAKLAEGTFEAVSDFAIEPGVKWASDPRNPLFKEGTEPTGGTLPEPFTFSVKLINRDANPVHIVVGDHPAGQAFPTDSRIDPNGGSKTDVAEVKALRAQRFTAGRNAQVIARVDCLVSQEAPRLAKVVFTGTQLVCEEWVNP